MRLSRRFAPHLTAGLLLAGLAASAHAAPTQWVHPFHATQPEEAPAEVLLAVEIPAGSFTKYEIGADDGLLHVDRFLAMPMAYPANYGSIPRSLAGDGDALDALVLTRAPLHPGSLIRFRPVGVLRMVDAGEADEKIVGVPVDSVDPSYAGIRDLTDLPVMDRQRIEAFFRVYKQLPDVGKQVELHGWGDAAEARRLIDDSLRRFVPTARP
ncbi:MAG: inorganic diphosphatase [Pseudoxanthomonas suwonensis]|nr:inorganic diphosphatase [Pseudoxanthomonas suwonensis]